MDGDGVQEVQLLPAPPDRGDKVGRLEDFEMLSHGLAGHLHALTQVAQALPVVLVEPVQEVTPRRVSQSLEHPVVVLPHSTIMQVSACIMQGAEAQVVPPGN